MFHPFDWEIVEMWSWQASVLACVVLAGTSEGLMGVGCLKISEDKSLERRIQTTGARLIIAITATPRRDG